MIHKYHSALNGSTIDAYRTVSWACIDCAGRLAWIAASIIQNEDTAGTLAFISELASFIADEVKG